MKKKVSLGASSSALKAKCLKKGVVVGRMTCAINDLYTQIVVLEVPEPGALEGILTSAKSVLGPLKRSIKAAAPHIESMKSAISKIESGEGDAKGHVKTVQDSFRKTIEQGFSECGQIPKMSDIASDLTGDWAYFLDQKK